MSNNIVPSVLDDIKQVDQSQTDLSKVVNILLNDDFHRRKTRLHKNIVNAISALDTISQIYDIDFFKQYLPTYTQYMTSLEGLGRQEIVDITKYSIDRQDKMNQDILSNLRR